MARHGLPSGSVAAAGGYLELHEPVSPELVLVDPELAKVARRSLPEIPEWRPQAQTAPSPVRLTAPAAAPVALTGSAGRMHAHAHRRHLPRVAWAAATAAPLLLLLLVGSVVVALVASEVRAQFSARVPPAAAGANWVPTTGEVEARTIALLVAGSAAAPAGLSNNRRLLADSVRVSCSQVGATARFACKLGVGPLASRQWRLTVLVKRGGTETLIWQGRAVSG
jgi:hypothetical protein